LHNESSSVETLRIGWSLFGEEVMKNEESSLQGGGGGRLVLAAIGIKLQ